MANERRLIDAYTLAEEIESLTVTVAGKPAKWNDAKHSVLRILAEQPDVDAVEVVRCKDCKHWDDDKYGCVCNLHSEKESEDYPTFEVQMLPCDFCSYGERKDDD